MSQSTAIAFFTRHAPADPQAMLHALLAVASPRSLSPIYRTLTEDHGWADASVDGPGIPYAEVEGGAGIEPARMARHYRPNRSIRAELYGSPFVSRVEQAISAGMGESVHGWCVPDSLFITVGFHDLFGLMEDDQPALVARAFLSVRFWRQLTPRNWAEYRKQVLEMPTVNAVRRDLETATGALEQCVFFNA